MTSWVLVLGVVATLVPHLATAKSDAVIEDSVKVNAPPDPKAGVSKSSSQKIQMVTATLKDILQSVVNEEAQETTLFNKYTAWCKTERADIAGDIKETRTDLANAKVLSQEQLSNIDQLKLFIKQSEKEIEETKDAVAQAVALRTDENNKYTEEMQLNTQSIRQIKKAIEHVSKVQKQGGFLQNGVTHKLQLNQPGESSYVFGIMKGLKTKLEKSRKNLKEVEEEKVKMHNSFMTTKGQSLKSLTDTTTSKKILLTETSAKQAGVEQKIGKLTEELDKLLKSAAHTDDNCQTSQEEWKNRQADRTREKAALDEAIRYLTQTAFEQISLVQAFFVDSDGEDQDSVVFAPSFLQEATSSQTSDAEFDKAVDAFSDENGRVEAHMKKDTFNGVKGVVSKLISAHKDTQDEEKKQRDYCQSELETKEDQKEDTANSLASVAADIEKKSSEVDMLADEVKALYASMEKVRKSVAEAGKVRKEQMAVFKAGSKDRALAMKVLKQAMTVLQNFYDQNSGSLLQQGAGRAPPPAKWGSSSPRKKTATFGAVSMVQDIADDIAKEQKDAAIQEEEAVAAYEKLQKDSQEANDNKQQDITNRVTAKAKLGVQINALKETKTEKSDELKSITSQISALHKECDELLEFFDKRKKDRSFEVDQLNDVMDILSGSSIAARTGFLQANAASSEEHDDPEASDAQ
jgi:chromosome segregation ATPase